MRRALQALFDTPQNNLRVFKNLNLVYGEGLRSSLVNEFAEFFNCSEESNESELVDFLCECIISALVRPLDDAIEIAADELNNNYYNQVCDLHTLPLHFSRCCPDFDGELRVPHNALHSRTSTDSVGGHGFDPNCVLGRILAAQRLDEIDSQALQLAVKYNEK